MAKATVTTRKVTLRTEVLKRAAAQNPDVRNQLQRQFARFTGREMVKVVNSHYQEALVQAADTMSEGVAGAFSGVNASRRTRFGTAALGYWRALTRKYLTKKRNLPGAGRFWKRTGQTGAFLRNLSNTIPSASLTNVKAEAATGGKSKVSVRISSTITVPSSGNAVIDGLVRDGFVQGKPTFVRRPSSVFTHADIIRVNEEQRPLLTQLAIAMGIRARQALSNLKQ